MEKDQKSPHSYADWKRRFDQEAKRAKRVRLRNFGLATLILSLLLFLSYNWYTGELQFFGQKTEYAKGEIVSTHMEPIGRGYSFQIIIYEFEYQGQVYTGRFRAGKATGMQKVGSLVRVKFASSNPNRSLMKGVYKE